MAPNTAPIFGVTPNVSGVALTAANTKSDGTGTIGTDIFKAFTAGTEGAYVSKVRVHNTATTAATATTATVVRVYLSSRTSGATTGGTDTFLLGELGMPTVTADATAAATSPQELPLNIAIPPGWTILLSMHLALAASTQMQGLVIGTDY